MSVGGMVCGILSIIFCWVPVLGLILGIIGISCGAKGMRLGINKGCGIAGLVCGIIGTVAGSIFSIVWLVTAGLLCESSRSSYYWY